MMISRIQYEPDPRLDATFYGRGKIVYMKDSQSSLAFFVPSHCDIIFWNLLSFS